MPAVDANHRAAEIERARTTLDDGSIAELLLGMTATPSPTGDERTLAAFIAGHLVDAGVRAEVQQVSGEQANVIARVPGSGDGPRVLVYAPLDTAFAGSTEEDRPFLGSQPRADFALPPRRDGTTVTGLGAENPKAFAAAGVVTLEAIAAAEIIPRGEIVLALASGSMPVDCRPGHDDAPLGWGSGVRHLLADGPRPDAAIVLKPGYAVADEEVGVAWYRITVEGAVNYTGIRHKGLYRNPILRASALVLELEQWLAAYAERYADDVVLPQGSVNAISAGSPDRASFVPASCEIDLDLRIAPDATLADVDAELGAFLDDARKTDPDHGIVMTRRFGLPGTRTSPDAWIVRALIDAWEAIEGRQHARALRTSGASDAGIIRAAGIPTARIGLPAPTTPSPFPGFSMGYADAASIRRLADVLIHALVQTTFLTRDEAGLP
jgi:acetylornithine deacetylase/succinyl-diaminopimelate desuccinylase-like protein